MNVKGRMVELSYVLYIYDILYVYKTEDCFMVFVNLCKFLQKPLSKYITKIDIQQLLCNIE